MIDAVCLVPDLAAFLEAIATWDRGHSFPVLIDDGDLAPRFIRAFRPARIVRLPGPVDPIDAEAIWERAAGSVARSWTGPDEDEEASDPSIAGRAPEPGRFGPCPPGVVVSGPSSPTLAGAVALAAGRFQPLIRWEPDVGPADLPPVDEALHLASDLAARIADRVGPIDVLGDASDFVTLAGRWPLRYRTPEGDNAFDDLLGFHPRTERRRLYTGRLVGSPAASAYEAMASLFLRPESALLFNGYDDSSAPWSLYRMVEAAEVLAPRVDRLERVAGAGADLAGWQRAFDPINRSGLVMVNSSGGSTTFSVRGGEGRTVDVPATVPAAVVMIHSHSAADPEDPRTLAGRWLERGAFAYFGALNEPYLLSFRTPILVANLLATGFPLGAALRQSEGEMFGFPWRLIYLGDPLYRPFPPDRNPSRLARWGPIEGWPEVEDFRLNGDPPGRGRHAPGAS